MAGDDRVCIFLTQYAAPIRLYATRIEVHYGGFNDGAGLLVPGKEGHERCGV